MSHLMLTLLLVCVTPPEPAALTPDTLKEYDYFFSYSIVNPRPAGSSEDMGEVDLRFAPKRRGQYAVGAEDLEQIAKQAVLVLRDRNVDKLSVPLRTEVDPGNYVHLHARFTVERELLSKLQLRFTDRSEKGEQAFIADLDRFIEQK